MYCIAEEVFLLSPQCLSDDAAPTSRILAALDNTTLVLVHVVSSGFQDRKLLLHMRMHAEGRGKKRKLQSSGTRHCADSLQQALFLFQKL